MKILVAGDFAHQIYEPELCFGLREAGAEVIELPVLRYFGPGDLLRRAQTKYVLGPGVALANAAFVAACGRHAPDAALAFRTPWLSGLAIEAARGAGAGMVALYNNDDPFGPDRALPIWKSFRKAIPHADLCLCYRGTNVPEYQGSGARRVEVFRSWFSQRLHRPMPVEGFACDAIFIGHAEDDGRSELLGALRDAGLAVQVIGTGWGPAVRALRGDDYARALCAAKMGLVFLSARNRDQYTRRCFEIPACGTAMLAPRTSELQRLFTEGEDALFFAGQEELVAQARRLATDEVLRARIAAAGRARVIRDGHDVISRARELVGLLS